MTAEDINKCSFCNQEIVWDDSGFAVACGCSDLRKANGCQKYICVNIKCTMYRNLYWLTLFKCPKCGQELAENKT